MAFLTPNLAYLIFYWLTHIAIVLLSALIKVINGTANQESISESFDIERHFWMFGVIILFCLLHTRELKRFFEQQTALRGERKAQHKQKEMTQVLDCQNDTIFVVSNATQEAEAPQCLFVNKESTEHFGFNLDASDGESSWEADEQFELKQFIPLFETNQTLFDMHSKDQIERFNILRKRIETKVS